jgi:hypothetical protein
VTVLATHKKRTNVLRLSRRSTSNEGLETVAEQGKVGERERSSAPENPLDKLGVTGSSPVPPIAQNAVAARIGIEGGSRACQVGANTPRDRPSAQSAIEVPTAPSSLHLERVEGGLGRFQRCADRAKVIVEAQNTPVTHRVQDDHRERVTQVKPRRVCCMSTSSTKACCRTSSGGAHTRMRRWSTNITFVSVTLSHRHCCVTPPCLATCLTASATTRGLV